MEFPYIVATMFMVVVALIAVFAMSGNTRKWKGQVERLRISLANEQNATDKNFFDMQAAKQKLTAAETLAETRRLHVAQRNAEIMQAASENAVLQETINELRQEARKQHFLLVNAKVTDGEKSHTLCLVVETERTGNTIPLRTLVKSAKNKAELVAISDKINKLTVNG